MTIFHLSLPALTIMVCDLRNSVSVATFHVGQAEKGSAPSQFEEWLLSAACTPIPLKLLSSTLSAGSSSLKRLGWVGQVSIG